ncbi:MAG: hypothetical protein AAF641_01335 [Pseudomonadota bacterium]
MAFGVILLGSVAGMLAAVAAAIFGYSLWGVLGIYIGASFLGATLVALLLILKKGAAKRRQVDTGAQGLAVKSSD